MKFFDSLSEASIQLFLKQTHAKKIRAHQVKGYGKLCQKLVSFFLDTARVRVPY